MSQIINVINRKDILEIVSKNNMMFAIENLKHWIVLNNKNYELLSNSYEYHKKILDFRCGTCGETFKCSWGHMKNNHGCPYCAGIKIPISKSFSFQYPELMDFWDSDRNVISSASITFLSHKTIWWKCPTCDFSWLSLPKTLVKNPLCPRCFPNSRSDYEDLIFNFLNFKHICFETEKSFADCKCVRSLWFDFYLPNLSLCIEAQGQQHFFLVDFAGRGKEWAEKQFDEGQIRDQIKRDYCKKNNICLIEIPYWDFDRIEEILIEELGL